MNAKIDIITPAGQSLKGFPINVFEGNKADIELAISNDCIFCKDQAGVIDQHPQLHPGDRIIIEVLP